MRILGWALVLSSAACGTSGTSPCGELGVGATLLPGEQVTSCDGKTALTLQTDGNLVLARDGEVMWATGTTTGAQAVMQDDGDFALYADAGDVLFETGTHDVLGACVVIDGFMHVDDPKSVLWVAMPGDLHAAGQ